MTWWIKFTTDKGAPKSRSRIPLYTQLPRSHPHTSWTKLRDLELARFLQLLRAIARALDHQSRSRIPRIGLGMRAKHRSSDMRVIGSAWQLQLQPDNFLTKKMADFEGNPFADPDGINPFAVSGNCNCQTDVQCGMAASMGYFIK